MLKMQHLKQREQAGVFSMTLTLGLNNAF